MDYFFWWQHIVTPVVLLGQNWPKDNRRVNRLGRKLSVSATMSWSINYSKNSCLFWSSQWLSMIQPIASSWEILRCFQSYKSCVFPKSTFFMNCNNQSCFKLCAIQLDFNVFSEKAKNIPMLDFSFQTLTRLLTSGQFWPGRTTGAVIKKIEMVSKQYPD